MEDKHLDVKAVRDGKPKMMSLSRTPKFPCVITSVGVYRGICTIYEDLGRFEEEWNKAIIITRFDESMQWE